ncbi:MAG: hypothetical protein V4443_06265 [Pseudomonadota bacterium]
MNREIIFLAALIFSAIPAAEAYDSTATFQSGKWTVNTSVNEVDNTAVCTAVYQGNEHVQLSSDALYVGVRGGISTVTLHLDDKPARPVRPATEREDSMGTVIFADDELAQVITSRKLHAEVVTISNGVQTIDLDLDGIGAAIKHIRSDCSAKAPENLRKHP